MYCTTLTHSNCIINQLHYTNDNNSFQLIKQNKKQNNNHNEDFH